MSVFPDELLEPRAGGHRAAWLRAPALRRDIDADHAERIGLIFEGHVNCEVTDSISWQIRRALVGRGRG